MVNLTNKIIGLDTNVFIYQFEQNEEFSPKTKTIFSLLVNKKSQSITSILTLAELLSIPAPEIDIENLKNHFLQTPNLIIQECNQTITTEAARIRRTYRFRLADSIQLATSLYAKANLFITNDQKLKSFKELSIISLKDI